MNIEVENYGRISVERILLTRELGDFKARYVLPIKGEGSLIYKKIINENSMKNCKKSIKNNH